MKRSTLPDGEHSAALLSRRDFAWRWGVLSFGVSTGLIVAVGWVITQFDSQYEASALVERASAGVLAGAFGALVLSPLSLVAGAVAALVAWRSRRVPTTESVSL